MKFVSSLCWVPKGKSSTPTQLKIDKNEMKEIFDDKPLLDYEDDDKAESDAEKSDNEDTKDIDKKYNMDEYDEEGSWQILAKFTFHLK